MPLSLNEIRDRARAFAKEWAGVTSERAEAQTFWNDFFNVFGVNRRRVAVFEQKARRFSGSAQGRIDVFWPGVMLAEHKSAGRDLDAAYRQATDYFAGLIDAELPRYVLVSDFARFRLHDLDGDAAQVAMPPALVKAHRQLDKAVDAACLAAEKRLAENCASSPPMPSALPSCSSGIRR